MKTVKKKLDLTVHLEKVKGLGCGWDNDYLRNEYTYTIITYKPIENLDTIEFYVEVDEPETLKEWLNETGIPKKHLVDWLNKNYKK